MSGLVTFGTLIDEAKDRADMVGSSLVSDTQWERYINKSKDKLYDKVISAYGEDYFDTDYDIPIVGSTDRYDLPSDFYKLTQVEHNLGGSEFTPMKRFTKRQRGRGFYYGFYNNYRYRLIGNQIHFSPTPTTGMQVKIWYIPLATNLVLSSDTLNGFNGWEEYIIIDAAIKAMRKEESDTTDLERDRADIEDKLNEMRLNRDAANPSKIADSSSEYSDIDVATGYW